jgi:hypothetical protein
MEIEGHPALDDQAVPMSTNERSRDRHHGLECSYIAVPGSARKHAPTSSAVATWNVSRTFAASLARNPR